MMSSSNQPRKKRRVDPQEGSSSGVSAKNLPLVSPNQIRKSSKDPHRGMYPRYDKSRNKRTLPCASFTKASKLLKESAEKGTANKKSEASDLSPAEASFQKGCSSSQKPNHLNQMDSKQDFKTSTQSSTNTRRKSPRLKFPNASNLANKIINYFKPIPESSRNKKYLRKTATNNTCDDPESIEDSADGFAMLNNHRHVSGLTSCEYSRQSLDEAFKTPALLDPCERKLRYYGLLEEPSGDKYDENSPSYFIRLPQHILETILCQLPFIDLMKNRLVCSAWRDVISDPKFMEWKKRYYGLKKRIETHVSYMEEVCARLKIVAVEDCFAALLKFMSTEFNRKPSDDMYNLLTKNTKAAQAELLLAERFPELLNKETKVWGMLAAALLISETVGDVHGVYKSLMCPKSDCSRHDITDAFYCVAAFLLFFKTEHGINHGLHYRVYNALYWIENELPSKNTEGSQTLRVLRGIPGQQSIHGYCEKSNANLTNEQLRILNHRLRPDQIIKIVALAGTGKTTTLIHFARLYPQLKFLNVMFNKAVCEDAKKRFPPNVICRTAHSLAYSTFGNKLRFKLSSKVRPHDIVPYLEHHAGSSLPIYLYAKIVLSTIEKFLYSKEDEVNVLHIPISPYGTGGYGSVKETDKPKVVKDATKIWQKMIDRDDKQLRITHDVYLKLYQLSKPKLAGYHCIMVDEAQDCNLAMLDIVMSQKLPVILVGDPNQQIYVFRGAVNALDGFTPTHVYHLTKSFRFGPEISYVASCCLEVLKTDHVNTIVGSNKPSCINGKAEGQYAIIARSNAQLFNEAIRICCQGRLKPNEPTVIHGCFAGGLKSYNFDQMLDICKLMNQGSGSASSINDKFIAKFRSFKDLAGYARNVEDTDLLSKIDMVSQHNTRIIDYIRIIKEKCSYSMALANIIFSTAHKSKGLEFDTVCLTDDYPIVPSIDYRHRRPVDAEESNIAYVALTRAKHSLILCDKLFRVLLAAQEKFEYPVPPSSIANGDSKLECIICCEEFTPHTSLILVRRKFIAASGRVVKGGVLCVKCATEPTVRPRIQIEPVVMYLDPTADYAHRSMAVFVGPLPSDPPIVHNSFGGFQEMDVVYVVNFNIQY